MFVCHANPKLCSTEQAVGLGLSKIIEQREQKLEVEILLDFKEF